MMDDKTRKTLFSVVFSFRNEEKNLSELIRRLRDVFSGVEGDYELIFVNDDSTDDSLQILTKYALSDTHIKIINMSRRWGSYACVVAGLRYTRGDAVIYMDSDLQDPPELIPEMIKAWHNGADVVNTIRTKRLGENPIKMWITKLAYRTINLFTDFELPENAGDFKLLSRRVVNIINTFDERVQFLKGITRWIGFKQENVFYIRDKRYDGKTHYPILSAGPVRAFIDGIVSFSSLPLYLSLFLGFTVSLLSLCYFFYLAITVFRGLKVDSMIITDITIVTFFGVLFFTIGVLGLYIEKIFDHTRRRPLYIVKDDFGFDKKGHKDNERHPQEH